MDADRFITLSLKDPRIIRILAAAINAVDPGKIVHEWLKITRLPPYNQLFILGIGKAGEPMTLAAATFFENFAEALVVTKHSLTTMAENIPLQILNRVKVIEAGHPLPDKRSLEAGQAVLDFTSHIKENDLLICLISGGGSSLVVSPRKGIDLEDIQLLTTALLNNGADIEELNTLRCQLDLLKGGGLAGITKGKILSLILSDVIGDQLEIIASGLTVPTPNAFEKVKYINKKYRTANLLSEAKIKIIESPKKVDDSIFHRVNNIIIANNDTAILAAIEKAKEEGFFTQIIPSKIQGEARDMGKEIAEMLKLALNQNRKPFCLVAGGETTVTIRGRGKGGRNQELALAAVDGLYGLKNSMLISLATDGNDGPTDAAGAVVTGDTKQRAQDLGMVSPEYLYNNDAYMYFEALGDLLKPGYTGTNVNDLIFLFGL